MDIRDETNDDAAEVERVITDAFADDGRVAAIWRDLHAGGLVRVGLVAEDAGAIVGHVGLSHCWVDARAALVDALTGRVVYPDVWWRHDAAGLRDPDLARIEAALG